MKPLFNKENYMRVDKTDHGLIYSVIFPDRFFNVLEYRLSVMDTSKFINCPVQPVQSLIKSKFENVFIDIHDLDRLNCELEEYKNSRLVT